MTSSSLRSLSFILSSTISYTRKLFNILNSIVFLFWLLFLVFHQWNCRVKRCIQTWMVLNRWLSYKLVWVVSIFIFFFLIRIYLSLVLKILINKRMIWICCKINLELLMTVSALVLILVLILVLNFVLVKHYVIYNLLAVFAHFYFYFYYIFFYLFEKIFYINRKKIFL